MATETITQIQQPPEFIEAAAKPYLTTLQQAVGDFTGADLSQVYGPQFVAGQDPLQAEAINVATAQDGLGSFRPFYKLQHLKHNKQVNLLDHKRINNLCLHFKKMSLEPL